MPIDSDNTEQPVETPQADSTSSILVAIEESRILLEHISRSGKPISNELMATVVLSKRIVNTDQWTIEAETNFWKSFNELSRSVKPVTVASLRAIRDTHAIHKGFMRQHLTSISMSTEQTWGRAGITANRDELDESRTLARVDSLAPGEGSARPGPNTPMFFSATRPIPDYRRRAPHRLT
jgi:hypothetical protein